MLSICNRAIIPRYRTGNLIISFKAIFLIAFAIIVSLGVMIAVWRVIGKLEYDNRNEDRRDDDSP